jgi:hypothetical protein
MDCDRPDQAPWDDLEQGFFASAPPDVPEPPPEPMRFDDLDPVPAARPERRIDAWRAAANARWTAAKVSAAPAWRKLAPLRASTAAAWRKVAPGVVAGSRRLGARIAVTARAGRAQLPRVVAVFQNSSRQTRLLAAGVAALVIVTGVSAGVVASRGAGPDLARPRVISVTRGPTVAVAAPAVAPVMETAQTEMTLVPDQDPSPSAAVASIAPSPAATGARKRKHTKPNARPAVSAKPAMNVKAAVAAPAPHGPAARPMFAR